MFGQLLMLSQTHSIDLQKVMSYPLSAFPWSLPTSDASLMKTNKATLMHKLEGGDAMLSTKHPEANDTYIIDGNALLQSLCGLPDTFGELAFKVFISLPDSNSVHFVTDRCDISSITEVERFRRAAGDSSTRIIRGPSTKLPRNWKSFLTNGDNKTAVIRLILNEWEDDKYASKLKNRKIYLSFQDNCTLLTSEDGEVTDSQPVQNLSSTQEEADTKIILHCLYASSSDVCNTIMFVHLIQMYFFSYLLLQLKSTHLFCLTQELAIKENKLTFQN